MQDFKTRFNYFIFSLIFLGFLIFLALGFILTIYGNSFYHLISAHEKNKTAMNIGLSMVPLGILWMLFFWGRILKNYRTILTLKQNSFILTDAIFLKTSEFPYSEIENYDGGIYLGDMTMKSIKVHLKSRKSVTILNSLTLNFNDLILELKKRKLRRLSA